MESLSKICLLVVPKHVCDTIGNGQPPAAKRNISQDNVVSREMCIHLVCDAA